MNLMTILIVLAIIVLILIAIQLVDVNVKDAAAYAEALLTTRATSGP